MKNVMFIKENGVVTKVAYNEETINKARENNSGKCFECKYAYASECPKVQDRGIKKISKYDFIEDCIYSFNEKGEQDLYISKCNKFEKDEQRKRATTREEIERLKYLKESIKILFYDCENIEEANRKQREIAIRNMYR